MSIVYNGTTIPTTSQIILNDIPISKVIYNGTIVWESSTVPVYITSSQQTQNQ